MQVRWIAVVGGLIIALGAAGCPEDDAESDGQMSTGSGSGSAGGSSGSTGAATTTTAGSGSGGELSTACVEDDDCALDSDCCHCRAYSGEFPDDHSCDSPPCFAPLCEGEGISVARCVESVCTAVIACDPSRVTCDALPPECPDEGRVPTVGPDNCWTGRCMPEEMCTPGQ